MCWSHANFSCHGKKQDHVAGKGEHANAHHNAHDQVDQVCTQGRLMVCLVTLCEKPCSQRLIPMLKQQGLQNMTQSIESDARV